MSGLAAAVIFAVAIASSSVAAERPEARKIDTGLGDFKVVFKVFQDCSKAQVSRWPSTDVGKRHLVLFPAALLLPL